MELVSLRPLITTTVLMFVHGTAMLSQTITTRELTLSNKSGVPFSRNAYIEDLRIAGFDVDSCGCAYFVDGNPTTLVKCDSGGRITLRKSYREFAPGPIRVEGGKLYLLDKESRNVRLAVLDAASGKIDEIRGLKKGRVANDSFRFADSLVIQTTYTILNGVADAVFTLISRRGEVIGAAKNRYGLPDLLQVHLGSHTDRHAGVGAGGWYLGALTDSLVFVEYYPEARGYRIWMTDSMGKTLQSLYLDQSLLAVPFGGHPEEHWKLRNRKLYILGRRGKMAVMKVACIGQLFGTNSGYQHK